MKLSGKVAVVTGAGSGIGRATAEQFAAEGATVVGLDISEAGVRDAVSDLSGAEGFAVDVSDSSAVDAVFSKIGDQYGRLDVLVNAAGVVAPSAEAKKRLAKANAEPFEAAKRGEVVLPTFLTETTDEDFARAIAINLAGPFYCMRAAVPLMKGTGGSIVNVSSVAALANTPGPVYYPASKAGLLGLTRATAAELAPFQIRVNAVAPGAVNTPLMAAEEPDFIDFLVSLQPIKRLASPEELAATMLFLASDESGYYTGQTLCPSGGLYM